MKPKTVKGLVHAGLAVTALAEALTAKTKLRKLLLGSMLGFHLHATLYHFVYEDENDGTSNPR